MTAAQAGTVDAVLEVARRNLGFVEGPNNDNPFAPLVGHANHQPWCASFVAAVFKRAEVRLPSTSPYTPTMAGGFKNEGHWHEGPAGAKAGDVMFFIWKVNGTRRIAHVGIVERWEGDGVVCIEGNTDAAGGRTGGRVMRQVRRANIAGYGRPVYAAVRDPLLRRGSRGPRVADVQRALKKAGQYTGKLDGDFGPATETAVRGFQRQAGLKVNGSTTRETWAALRKVAHG